MDKWRVNNYIVQMRSSVAQSRVHVLNKLVREIRKLKDKKGTDEQKEKNCRKAKRLKEEILLIKKLSPDEISRCALLYTENPSDMLQKVSLSLEERAKVRLSAHKNIAVEVSIFRKKYPDWGLKLPPLMVQLGLKNRRQENMTLDQKQIPIDNQNLERTQVDRNIENSKVIQNIGKPNINQNTGNTKFNEKDKKTTGNFTKEHDLPIPVDKSDMNKSEVSDNLTLNADSLEDSDTRSDEEMNSQNKISKLAPEAKQKTSGIAEIRRFVDLLESNINSEDSAETSSDKDDDIPNSTNVVTDPFFLTGDDSAESEEDTDDRGKSNQIKIGNNKNVDINKFSLLNKDKFERRVNIKVDNKDDKRAQQSSEVQQIPTMNRKQRRMMQQAKADMKGVTTSSQHRISRPKQFEVSLKRIRGCREDITEFFRKDSAKAEVLHPSWEAKRKQRERQVVLPFQGKKIKFDDDDDD